MIHDGHLFALAVYVDDCFLIGKQSNCLTLFKHYFSSRFKIEDLVPATWILRCSIIGNRSRGTLLLVQTQYLKDVLQSFDMSECTPMLTQIAAKPSKSVTTVLDKGEMPNAKLIGKLFYASNFTRPNIIASVNYLSRYMFHPGVEHWLQAKRLLRYLEGTLDKGLTINRIVPYTPVDWQNSSFADGPDGKPCTWYVVLMC
jgi:histone deacetylase 1/2